ncbi:MAG: hypothetical protein GWO16_11915 [Gammaproteobacteria bacterium]|nr:hypothetical protein [Gammaproteobacteria bacterium]NIR98634.1 hypothetical protein [Gammaproteobacteria bacterium]NIT64357.1 hypothetical protein [Gammaproteobacteria bacterium]NIV21281.1 hypothetical protein [Gammaproteobacteria bacterium]NIX10985.1 hypothetical protein [Gammaproteobacteria bacterium]
MNAAPDPAGAPRHPRAARRVARRALYERVVIVTRRTELEELTSRFVTEAQARFYLEHAGQDFEPIEQAHRRYHAVLDQVRHAIPVRTKHHVIPREYLPQYAFEEADLVVTVGPDGLVVNTAKYLERQPLLAFNPDPGRIEGVLLPYAARDTESAMSRTLAGEVRFREVTMAEARLNDGQKLVAFNDLFVGARSHVSARYRLVHGQDTEEQSSSGIIVSTGAGSTGWLKSVYAGAAAVSRAMGGHVDAPRDGGRFSWEADHLVYAVREPWPSKSSGTTKVYGRITPDAPLLLDSHMPGHGVIFSDGVEADYLPFNAGTRATITLADRKARLVA